MEGWLTYPAVLTIEMMLTPHLVLHLAEGREAVISLSTDLQQWAPLWNARTEEVAETFRWDLSEYLEWPATFYKMESSVIP